MYKDVLFVMKINDIGKGLNMAEKQFRNGEVIFKQGDNAGSFYQVAAGKVGIYLAYGKEDELKLTEVEKDQYFGEMGVIETYPRSATAVALEDDTRVVEIAGGEINKYFNEKPENVYDLIRYLSKRTRDLTKDYTEVCAVISELGLAPKQEKSEGLLARIKKHAFFYRASGRSVDSLGAETAFETKATGHAEGFSKKVESFRAGTVICREGETRNCMYDIHWGKVGIYSGFGTDKEQKLTELYPNSFFGEAGMIGGEPRSATAVALDDNTTIEIITPEDLAELFEKNPAKVDMFLQHVSGRLRKLTNQYMGACQLVYEASESNDISEATAAKLREYKAHLYD